MLILIIGHPAAYWKTRMKIKKLRAHLHMKKRCLNLFVDCGGD